MTGTEKMDKDSDQSTLTHSLIRSYWMFLDSLRPKVSLGAQRTLISLGRSVQVEFLLGARVRGYIFSVWGSKLSSANRLLLQTNC